MKPVKADKLKSLNLKILANVQNEPAQTVSTKDRSDSATIKSNSKDAIN